MPCPITMVSNYFYNETPPDCDCDYIKNNADDLVDAMNYLRIDKGSQYIVLLEVYNQWCAIINTPWKNDYPVSSYDEWNILKSEIIILLKFIEKYNLHFYKMCLNDNLITKIDQIILKYFKTQERRPNIQHVHFNLNNTIQSQDNSINSDVSVLTHLLTETQRLLNEQNTSNNNMNNIQHINDNFDPNYHNEIENQHNEYSDTDTESESETESETDVELQHNDNTQQEEPEPDNNLENGSLYTDVNGVDWYWSSDFQIWEISPEFAYFSNLIPPVQIDGETISFQQDLIISE